MRYTIFALLIILIVGCGHDGKNGSTGGSSSTATIPTSPTLLTATTQSSSTIQLSWKDNSDNEVEFVINYLIPPATTFTLAGIVGTSNTATATFTHTGLTSETQYIYRVKARNDIGESLSSNETTATTLPSKITERKLPPPNGFGIDVQWNALGATPNQLFLARGESSWMTNGGGFLTTNEILSSTDNGVQWASSGLFQGTSISSSSYFVDMFLHQGNTWWRLDRLIIPAPPWHHKIYTTTDAGITWKEWTKPNVAPAAVTSIRFGANGEPNLLVGYATPQYASRGIRWDGQQWQSVDFPISVANGFSVSINELSPHDEIIAAADYTMGELFGTTDTITWRRIFAGTTLPPNGDRTKAYGKTSDGRYFILGGKGLSMQGGVASLGNTYTEYRALASTLVALDPTTNPVVSAFTRDGRIWLGTRAGEIFYSPDSGTTWELLVTFQNTGGSDLSFLFAHDGRQDVWILEVRGEKIIRHHF